MKGEISIVIDDPGPGIPASQRRAGIHSFLSLEHRVTEKRCAGLGLSLARDYSPTRGGYCS